MKIPPKNLYRLRLRQRADWLQREHNTAALVRFCYEDIAKRGNLDAEAMFGLCRLTWITKGRYGVSDRYLFSTKLPGLSAIFRLTTEPKELDEAVRLIAARTKRSTPKVREVVAADTGIVNLRNSFRNLTKTWIRRHEGRLRGIFRNAAGLSSDDRAMELSRHLQNMPSVSARGASAYTVLSPVLACLDPRKEFPIVNRGRQLESLFKELRINHKTPLEKYQVMVGLLGPDRCTDAFELDVMGEDALLLGGRPPMPTSEETNQEAELALHDETEIAIRVGGNGLRRMRRVHNAMSRALKELWGDQVEITEGRAIRARYDALVKRYDRLGHDLLVEIKSTTDVGSIRLAIGQLLDYRRHLKRALATHMGILLPAKPDADVLSLLCDLRIRAFWFTSASLKNIACGGCRSFRLPA